MNLEDDGAEAETPAPKPFVVKFHGYWWALGKGFPHGFHPIGFRSHAEAFSKAFELATRNKECAS